MHDTASAQPSPFVEIDRRSWAKLAPSTQLPLTEAETLPLPDIGIEIPVAEFYEGVEFGQAVSPDL